MEQKEIERLKEICKKEGFTITEKDPWDGVEFVKCVKDTGHCTYFKNKIYRVNYLSNSKLSIYGENGELIDGIKNYKIFVYGNRFGPSTEAAYIEQLKKEAFKLYGEIKDGDKFQFYGKGFHSIKLSDTPELDYFKEFDELSLWGFPLYKQGKWAKKQEERVEVAFDYAAKDLDGYSYKFTIENFKSLNHKDIGEHLASQLEKYLNNEINK